MKIKVKYTEKFINSIDAVYELLKDETTLEIGKEGMRISALDGANVSQVVLKVKPEAFEDFDLDRTELISIDMEKFQAVLKRVKDDDGQLTLETDNKKLYIISGEDDSFRKFTLPLIDMDEKLAKPPKVTDFQFMAQLNAEYLDKSIKDMLIASDNALFEYNDGIFRICADGDLGKVEVVEDADTSEHLKVFEPKKSTEAIKSRYSLDYLKKIIKARKVTDNMQIMFSKDYPLRLIFSDPDVLSLEYILAPRVEND